MVTKGKTNVKYLFIVIILAVFAGGLMVGALEMTKCPYWWPSFQQATIVKDRTAGWKVYENQEYGFEIKYPQDWNYGPNLLRLPQEPHLVFCPPELIDTERGCKWYTQSTGVVNTLSPILLFVEDWDIFRGTTKEEKKNIAWCELQEKKTVNNIEMEFIDCDGQKRVYWEDPAGDNLYKFFLANSEFSTEFYQMVSTFNFLK